MSAFLKVLHIEDDTTDAMLMHELIKTGEAITPMELTHVESLKDGLNTLSSTRYDAVLLDLNLRDLSGPDNVRMLSEQAPEVPIIILSGDAHHNSITEAIKHGAQEYLIKGHCDGTTISLAIRASIQRKIQERLLFNKAYYDELTNLPNSSHIISELKKRLLFARRENRDLALIYFGVDKMKEINKKYGTETGNQILQEVALRAQYNFKNSDFFGRYRGDEFLFICAPEKGNSLEYAQNKLAVITEIMGQPYQYSGQDHHFSVSCGIAITNNTADTRTLIHQAMTAMAEAKHVGAGSVSIYTSSNMAA